VVAAVALLTVTALGSLLVNRPNQRSPDLTTPSGVVTAYVQAVQAQQADRAWDLLAHDSAASASGEPPRPPLTKEQFRQEVQYAHRETSSRVRILSVTQPGDTAEVQLEITDISSGLFSGASSHTVTMSLRREGTSWRITSDPSPWQFQ
jgi:ketosteroid isomerase-like protein